MTEVTDSPLEVSFAELLGELIACVKLQPEDPASCEAALERAASRVAAAPAVVDAVI